ncbi:MAG: hypothetical protein ACM3Q2_07650 [Syntrophothermus sp.]
MKKTAVICALFLVSSIVFGQYKTGKNTAAAFLGIGGGGISGTGGIPIGVEYNFYNYGQNIQAGAFAAFSSTSEDFVVGKWNYTNIIIAAQANYHFMPGDKLDPFAGIALGYDIASSSTEYKAGFSSWNGSASSGGFVWSAQAGLNYWFTPKYAAQIRVGYFPYVSAGITIAM